MTIQKKHIQEQSQPASDLPAFNLMFESHPAIMLLIEPETGLILEGNPAAVQFYGYPKSKLCGLPIDALITYPLELVAKTSDKKLEETNFLHRLASGEVRSVEVLSSALISEGKQLQFWIVNDITERKRAEENLLNLQIYRASDLFNENEEIAFQNEEKEKRAAELIIATKELAFQNEEKEKRAAELIIANKELAFQNEEKEKRAAELIIANKELAFQNEEKEKRAAELVSTNKELVLRNQEKAKLAAELIIAQKQQINVLSIELGNQAATQITSEAILSADNNGIIIAWNMGAEKIFGYTKDEAIGIPVTQLIPLKHQSAHREAMELFHKHPGKSSDGIPFEAEGCRKNGSLVQLEISLVNLLTGMDWVHTVIVHDISFRKQTEQTLAQTATHLSLAVHAGGVGIWDYDMVNDKLIWDDQMYHLYGITPQDFSGAYSAWQQGLHPQDRERCQNEFLAAKRAEKEYDTEFRVVWPDGSVHNIRALALIRRDIAGEPLSMIGTNWDITERKQLDQDLQGANLDLQKALLQRDIALEQLNNKKIELEMQNEELLASQEQVDLTRARYFDLYELAPVGYCTVSEKGLILEANLKAATLLGLTRSAMIKRPLSFFIARQNIDIYYRHTRQLRETGLPQTYELQMQKKDGSTFWARLETSEALDTDTARMLRVVISDISELKAAETQTRDRLKELSCLNDVSRLAFNPGLTEQQLCQKVIEHLIPALGHPEIAAAEILLNGKVYQSPNFSNSFNTRLTASILHNNEQCGQLTVCYTQTASFIQPEEQNLLENIATILGLWNERKISDKDVKKLSQAVEQSPLSIFITKPDGTIEYANAHFCSLTGYSISEIVGKNPRILQSNFTSKEEYKLLWETILSGQIWEGKFLNTKKDGTLFWEKATIAPMFDEMGRIIHFLAVKENITAQTIMENDLHQSESHNRALLDAIPDMIFRIRRDGIILDCKDREDLIGTSIYDQLDKSMAVDVNDLINKTLRSGQVQSMNIEIKLKDGSHVFEARLKDTGNTEVVAIVRDISEQSRLEQMKTDFINRASHELRTPIATMLLMADLLDEKMQGENADEFWDVLKSELQRERGLIEHLLNTGLLEGKQDRTNFRALEIDALIQQAVHSFEPAAREKGISLNVALIPAENAAPRLIQGDQHGLNLVLTNLVGNAIKFTPSGGNVSIQTRCLDGNLLISIIDSGIGIPSQDLPLLFSRFFRGSNAIDEEIQGTGLGLFLVRSILEKHHGSIQVTSELGAGSRFDVWLPL